MLIQNTGNTAQAPQPARSAGDSAPNAVVATRSNVDILPAVSPELPQAAAQQVAAQPASAEQVKSAVENINKVLKQNNMNLEFSVDDSTNRTVFKLKDSETGDVIRQYPTEEMLAISRAIGDIQQGLLLKQDA